MTLPHAPRVSRLDCLVLLPVMALALYIAFIPHQGYPYPLHLDEWFGWACASQIIGQGSVTGLADPFSGGAPSLFQFAESGFHLFWGVFHQISGVSWLTIFRYFPGIILVATVLSVYILAQRQGFGGQAALFACLVPTTVGILGPAFLVPVATAMLFVPLAMFLAFHLKGGGGYVALFVFTSCILVMHAYTAVVLVIVLLPFLLLNLRGDLRHSLGVALAVGIPFLALLPWAFPWVKLVASSLLVPQSLSPHIDYPRIIMTLGYLPVFFCLLGVLWLALRGGRKDYALVLGLLALLLMLVTFHAFHYGIGGLYERGLLLVMLLMSIVAGAGLAAVGNLRLPEKIMSRLRPGFLARNAGILLCLVLIGVTLAIAIPARQDTPYYHMIDDADYQAFLWIEGNVTEDYDRAVLDPWKGTAFTAITGKMVYSRITMAPGASDEAAHAFLAGGCEDTSFLTDNGISIVYTTAPCSNPALEEVRDNVYLLEEPTAPD